MVIFIKGNLIGVIRFPDLCYLYRSKWEDWEMCSMATKSTFIMIGSALTIFIVNSQTIIIDNHFGGSFMLLGVIPCHNRNNYSHCIVCCRYSKNRSWNKFYSDDDRIASSCYLCSCSSERTYQPGTDSWYSCNAYSISIINYYKSLKNKSN